jgi:hypothetical protein
MTNKIVLTMCSGGSGRFWCNVDVGDNRFHMLNEKSLDYFMKHQLCLTSAEREQIHILLVEAGRVEFTVASEQPELKVS